MLENQQLTLVSQRVRLDVHIEDVTLVADRGKIRLILENLLSNAIKYSPRGGVIYLRARAGGEQLMLEVARYRTGHSARGSGAHLRGVLHRPRARRARTRNRHRTVGSE